MLLWHQGLWYLQKLMRMLSASYGSKLENTFAAALRAVGEGNEAVGEDFATGPRQIYKAPLLYLTSSRFVVEVES